MTTLLQIHIGDVPTILGDCIDSQIRYATDNRFDMVKITSLPDEYEDYDVRTASDLVRVEYLKNNSCVLYCDWDIRLYDNFCIPDPNEYYYGYYADSIIYNGNRTDIYKKVYDLMPKDRKFEEGLIFKIFKNHIGMDPKKFLHGYCHFNYRRV